MDTDRAAVQAHAANEQLVLATRIQNPERGQNRLILLGLPQAQLEFAAEFSSRHNWQTFRGCGRDSAASRSYNQRTISIP